MAASFFCRQAHCRQTWPLENVFFLLNLPAPCTGNVSYNFNQAKIVSHSSLCEATNTCINRCHDCIVQHAPVLKGASIQSKISSVIATFALCYLELCLVILLKSLKCPWILHQIFCTNLCVAVVRVCCLLELRIWHGTFPSIVNGWVLFI